MAPRLLGMEGLIYEPPAAGEPLSPALNGRGKVLISASDAGERSWGSDQLQSSIFTHYFLDGLAHHQSRIKEAFEDTRPLARQQVKREKGADVEQTPQVTPSRAGWEISLSTTDLE